MAACASDPVPAASTSPAATGDPRSCAQCNALLPATPLPLRSLPAELEYFTLPANDLDAPGAIHVGRALCGLLLSLAATCAAIAIALAEPPPTLRQLLLAAVAIAAGTGIVEALLAMRAPRTPVEQTLVISALVLGGLALAAAGALF